MGRSRKQISTPKLQIEISNPSFVQLEIDGLEYELQLGGEGQSIDLRDIAFDLQAVDSKSKQSKSKPKIELIGWTPEFPPETEVDVLHFKSYWPDSKCISYWISGYQIWIPDFPVGHAKGHKRKKQEPKLNHLAVVRNHRYDSRILWVPESNVRKACSIQDHEKSFEFDEIF